MKKILLFLFLNVIVIPISMTENIFNIEIDVEEIVELKNNYKIEEAFVCKVHEENSFFITFFKKSDLKEIQNMINHLIQYSLLLFPSHPTLKNLQFAYYQNSISYISFVLEELFNFYNIDKALYLKKLKKIKDNITQFGVSDRYIFIIFHQAFLEIQSIQYRLFNNTSNFKHDYNFTIF